MVFVNLLLGIGIIILIGMIAHKKQVIEDLEKKHIEEIKRMRNLQLDDMEMTLDAFREVLDDTNIITNESRRIRNVINYYSEICKEKRNELSNDCESDR